MEDIRKFKILMLRQTSMKQMTEGKENVDLVYSSTLLFIFKERIKTGIQASKNPDAGVDTEVMEGYSILACFQ